MQEILTIQVTIKECLEVKGKGAEAAMLAFDGECDCDNFKGKILSYGVDTQKQWYPDVRTLSARYMLEGIDKDGEHCRIFIENNGFANENGIVEETTPRIITDSKCLSWMETVQLTGTITPKDNGVVIHIFSE